MEIKCNVHEIGVTQQVSDSFAKRDLVVVYAENPTYPEYIRFETIKDKTKMLDELRKGDEITVHFNLRGRPWTNKEGITSYFNSLVAWKIDVNKTTATATTSEASKTVYANSPAEDDDLPF